MHSFIQTLLKSYHFLLPNQCKTKRYEALMNILDKRKSSKQGPRLLSTNPKIALEVLN
jgi:hypothetical protein